MNKFKVYFIVLCSVFALFSCSKTEDTYYEPLRFYSDQYVTDLAIIEDYLKTHYIEEIIDHPGFSDDQDIKLTRIPSGNTTLQAIFDSPLLYSKEVLYNNFTYKVYYLKTREGVGTAPSKVDQVLASYDGYFLSYNSEVAVDTRFEYVPFPDGFLPLDQTIVGWPEIFSLFKPGTSVNSPGNPTQYNDFGAGVMFLPSALAYYNQKKGTIPAYSSLIFRFKLHDMKRADQDNDGIVSVDEDLNHDGLFNNDDTDGDGVQNYIDSDDDGDGYLTRAENKKPAGETSGNSLYYPFNAILDNPSTPDVDEAETKGVPDCSGNFNASDRLRKYLDSSCH